MTTLRIVQDAYPSNPRTEFDQMCLMACAHGRYNLGDEKAKSKLADKLGVYALNYTMVELVNMAHAKGLVFFSKSLYLYDHSGITIATTPFSCPWDSGQVGEILIFTDAIKAEFGVKRLTAKKRAELLEVAEKRINSEVAEYDAYLTGDIFTLQFLDEDGDVEDSISGFIGSDIDKNGMIGNVDASMIEALRSCEVSYA